MLHGTPHLLSEEPLDVTDLTLKCRFSPPHKLSVHESQVQNAEWV
jgi:hypothetical protein